MPISKYTRSDSRIPIWRPGMRIGPGRIKRVNRRPTNRKNRKIKKILGDGLDYKLRPSEESKLFTAGQTFLVHNAITLIPKYDLSAATAVDNSPSSTRQGDKIYIRNVNHQICLTNTSAVAVCVRYIIFRNSSRINLNTSALNNMFEDVTTLAGIAPSTDIAILPQQQFNFDLVKRKGDLIKDTTYYVGPIANHSTYHHTWLKTLSVPINRMLNYPVVGTGGATINDPEGGHIYCVAMAGYPGGLAVANQPWNVSLRVSFNEN